MQRSPKIIYTSPAAAAILARRRRVTHDACSCDGRARRITRDDSAAATVILLALRHMETRLAALEARVAGGNDQAAPIDQRLAEAEQKRVDMLKDLHASKIERMAAEHEADKQPNENSGPTKPEPPKDDREKVRFIPVHVGAQRMIEDYLALAGHRSDLEGALFRPVKNNRTGELDRPLDPASVYRNQPPRADLAAFKFARIYQTKDCGAGKTR
jgi:hypothetical protein